MFVEQGKRGAQLRVTMITPPPTPTRLVKLRKEKTHILLVYFLSFLLYCIILISIIWQRAYALLAWGSGFPRRTR